jgi:hypothetical protein
MRVLALLLVLLGMPALAGTDHTRGSAQEEQVSSFELAQAQAPAKGQGQGQPQSRGGARPTPSLSGGDYPGRYCCVHCRHNEIPCGGECIPAGKGSNASTSADAGGPGTNSMCKKAAGCACSGKP